MDDQNNQTSETTPVANSLTGNKKKGNPVMILAIVAAVVIAIVAGYFMRMNKTSTDSIANLNQLIKETAPIVATESATESAKATARL